jgi:hypothetical protein
MNTLIVQMDVKSFSDRINSPELVAKAAQQLANFDPSKLTLQGVLQIGQDTEKKLARHLDLVLEEFNAENSPFVFGAFKELQDGIKAANLQELEQKIKEAKTPGFFGSVFRALGLGSGLSKKKIIEFANNLSHLLKGKRETLLDLVKKMEESAKSEVSALLTSLDRMDGLAKGHLETIDDFAVAILYIEGVLQKTKVYVKSLEEEVNGSEDVAKQFNLKQYKALLVQLENRRLVLLNEYENTPLQLDTIALAKEAAANTFTEIANTLMQGLNATKSGLAKWAILVTIENSQAGNELRHEIAKMLLEHGVTILDRVAIAAASTPYERRLADAELLLAMRTGVACIQAKVVEVDRLGRDQFKRAENLLLESRKMLALPTSVAA